MISSETGGGGAGALAFRGAVAGGRASAAFMSRSIMRPCGPEPRKFEGRAARPWRGGAPRARQKYADGIARWDEPRQALFQAPLRLTVAQHVAEAVVPFQPEMRPGAALLCPSRRLQLDPPPRPKHRDDVVDRHVVGAFRHHDFREHAFVGGFEFHRRLVGFDLGEHIAALDFVALPLQPAQKIAFVHRRRKRWHQNIHGHIDPRSGARELYCGWSASSRWRRIRSICSSRRSIRTESSAILTSISASRTDICPQIGYVRLNAPEDLEDEFVRCAGHC